ncbi:ATP-binding protein [Streptomyces venezuelae]|uniref:ATP-binding protein n=1 Tax=Streptomyces venezuelae TaxID=54571 RepID=A0A5P2D025_STRVZ|nr:NACHT domain-containing protein [Streptomyces venezuelae]QES48053.1 ATP-binding protein [Streptomyces venezuelae]
MSAEVAAINLGRVLATRAAGLWLAPKRRAQEGRSELSELIRVRVAGLRPQRSLERQFEQIADAVAARLEPLLAHEFRGLSEAGRRSALDAVTDTFTRADLSDAAIIGSDADAAELARRIRRAVPAPAGLDEPAEALYELLFSECCDCYVRVLRRLPVFTERAVTELLGRTTSLAAELSQVLERLPARSLYAPEGEGRDEAFRREYLELVSRSLDEIELFSFASERAARTKLSVAYVSLRTTQEAVPHAPEDDGHGRRVESALKDADRVLLRGEAGSGKTTLLQWLAVTAARGAFEGELAAWNGLVPVPVTLRRYAGRELPSPEALLDEVAGPLTGHMPTAWVDRQLAAGRALLLVDGVDELPAAERRAVRDWLRRLLLAYPANRAVVTSRPAAARSDWLRAEGFRPVLLDRMRPADLAEFVRQWHEAVLDRDEELPDYERALLTSLQNRPHLQSLAATPLLAALLCALHLDRRGQLPRNRMELYRIALEILVQRRDAERCVPSGLDVQLTLTDKLRLLQDLAWRLSDNGRNEIARQRAEVHVHYALGAMRHLEGFEASAVLDHLVARSGVLRSPADGRIDFLHRSFQEYLAAADAAVQDNIGNLVGRAHLDFWYETIVMAAGHANRTQRTELIEGVLGRAAAEPRHRRRLKRLAASCLETMEAVPEEVVSGLDEALDSLIPPSGDEEAAALAAVGPAVLSRLPGSLSGLSTEPAEATVRTAALIGGSRALDRLAHWVPGAEGRSASSLAGAWGYFDPDEYAERVLRRLPLTRVHLTLTHPTQWPALLRLPDVRRVGVVYPFFDGLAQTTQLAGLHSLTMYDLRNEADLAPLRHHDELTSLTLRGNVPLTDATPLRDLPRLDNLALEGWVSLPPLRDIPVPAETWNLSLGRLAPETDLASLTDRPALGLLDLRGRGEPRGFDELSGLSHLFFLAMDGYDLRTWLPAIRSAPRRLGTVAFRDCLLPADLGSLASLGTLETLYLYGCRTADGRPPNLDSVPEGINVRLG